jgi:anti-anti-sigma factor
VLDIDGVSFIDSTGLRAILEAHMRSQQNGNRLRFTKGSEQAQRLFALAAVDQVLPFVDS